MVFLFILLIVLFALYNNGQGTLKIDKSNALKAFFPYVIILHHVSQMTGDVLDFRWAGPYGVGVFFFISGYGLEYKRSCDLLNLPSFIKRIKSILVPIILPVIIYLILLSTDGIDVWDYTIKQLYHPAIVFSYTWFVIVLMILYSSYYILSHLFPTRVFVAQLLFLVFYSAIMILLRKDGTFFITTYCFLAGAVYQNREELIQKWQTNFWFVTIAIIVLLLTTIVALFPPPFKGYAAFGALMWTICFIFLYTKIDFRYNKVLDHLKSISYDVFLCQGLAFYVLTRVLAISDSWLFATLSVILSFIMGEICYTIRKGIKL